MRAADFDNILLFSKTNGLSMLSVQRHTIDIKGGPAHLRPPMQMVHGTAVQLGRAGLLLRGPSGSGKSDLALRLIESGAALIADDQVAVAHDGAEIWLSAPPSIAGMIEVRGLGILRLPRASRAALRLVCDLVAREAVERLPERGTCAFFGVAVPQVALCGFDASTPAKLRFALRAVAGDDVAAEPLAAQP